MSSEEHETSPKAKSNFDPNFLHEKIRHSVSEDPNRVAFVVGILVGILTLVLLFVWRKGKAKRRTILIAGPCDGGKTAMFGRLVHGSKVDTFTSMKENASSYVDNLSPAPKVYEIVDLPGHERLRLAALDKYKLQAVAVLYVIDASTFKQQIRDSAEFLFQIISDPVLFKNRVSFLIACNKQDASMAAKGASVIAREMARELDMLRETNARLLDRTDGTGVAASQRVFLGKEGKAFEFSDLKAKVEFCETSAMTDSDNSGVIDVRRWISSLS